MRRALAGRHLPPRSQRAFETINRGVISSMLEDPAKRLAETTGRRTYTGGDLVVQSFLRPPAGPNDQASIELSPIQVNARRTVNGTRGRLADLL
jgi:hypothetical protein